MTEAEQANLGYGPKSLLFNELRHTPIQKDYSAEVLRLTELANTKDMQEAYVNRYKKVADDLF